MPISNEYKESKKEPVMAGATTYSKNVYFCLASPITLPLAQLPILTFVIGADTQSEAIKKTMDLIIEKYPQFSNVCAKNEMEINQFMKAINCPPNNIYNFTALEEPKEESKVASPAKDEDLEQWALKIIKKTKKYKIVKI